jgi:uncharacterized protein
VTIRVTALRTTPVKGFPQRDCDQLELEPDGITADRRFVILDGRDHVLYAADLPEFLDASADWDGRLLTLALPDGTRVSAEPEIGEQRTYRTSGGREVPVALVDGPFADALERIAGRPLRLAATPVGRGSPGPVTLISEATVDRLAAELGVAALDHRRFKMSVTVSGCEEHTEDTWSGGRIRIGEVELEVGGQVPRCVLTTRDPDTGVRDLDTLRTILAYRAPMETGEAPLGVYATVVTPGTVRLGDTVAAI